jgi:hypothetical protein
MTSAEAQLGAVISLSQLGRYEIVKLALKWILVNQQDEDYKKLTQTELINRALSDVVLNVATAEKIEELRKKNEKKPKY